MNTARKTLLVVTAALLLAACASTPRADLAASPKHGEAGYQDMDHHYVAAVERASRTAGVRVVWVNPPRKAEPED